MRAQRNRETVGRRVLAERQRCGLSAAELSERANLSPSDVSDIETGRATPSVGTLYQLAQVLQIPVDVLLDDSAAEGPRTANAPISDLVVSSAGRRKVELAGGVRWEMVRPPEEAAADNVEILEVIYAPNAESSSELTWHEGREYGLVLDGRLEVQVEDGRASLGPGDSLAFDSTRPHRIFNTGDEPARALWTVVRSQHSPAARSALGTLAKSWISTRRGGAVRPILLATVLLFAISPLLASGSLSHVAILSMLPFAAVLAIAALGQTLVVQQGGLDLSVGGMMSLAAVLVTTYPNQNGGKLVIGIVLVIAVALLVGLVNGLAVSVFGISPFVATLAMGTILLGFVQQVSNGSPTSATGNLSTFALHQTLGVPNTVIVAAVFVAIAAIVVKKTVVGRYFEATGANPTAAHAAAVPVFRYVVGTYMMASVCYGVAGILLAGYVNTPGILSGQVYLLPTVAAVVLGGTALTGGSGSVVASAIGALFLTQVNQLVLDMGAQPAMQFIIQGVIIALGMSLRVVPWKRLRGVHLPLLGRRPSLE